MKRYSRAFNSVRKKRSFTPEESKDIRNMFEKMYLRPGKIVFFSKTEEVWDKPFVRKAHHDCPQRCVILRGEVIEVRGNEFMAKLVDNNGFEKDGETFVFSNGSLLSNQNYTDFDKLGKWKYIE